MRTCKPATVKSDVKNDANEPSKIGGAVKLQTFTTLGMVERQCAGMERQSLAGPLRTVQPVSEDRMPKALFMGAMHPKLMRPTSQWGEQQAGGGCPVSKVFYTKPFPLRNPRLAIKFIVDLPWTMLYIEAKRKLYRAAGIFYDTVYQCDVLFLNRTLHELHTEVPMRRGVERKQQQSGGIHVQAVDGGLADAIGEQPPQPGLNAVLLVLSPPRHGQQP